MPDHGLFLEVETMGLEPTTPCLQIRPTRTRANGDERRRQVRRTIRTVADGRGRYRFVTTSTLSGVW